MSLHESRVHAGGNQLDLWAEPGAPPMLGLRVLRGDGREAAFDVDALSDSIRRAGWPGEALDADTAGSLARAVRLYLQQSPQPVSLDTVRETVERLLVDMGYTLTARMYAGAFAPPIDDMQHRASAAGMFDEALPIDRAERFLAAAAADAGLSRADADALLGHVLAQIRAAGLQRLTPGLLREWMRSELHARGLPVHAGRIARLSLPVNALHDAFTENDRPPATAPGDPESAALALAGRVSAAYVLGQLVPSAAGQAHLRGDIQVRGIGNFLRLDSAQLDARRLISAQDADVAPELYLAHLSAQTDSLARFFGGELTWPSINFALARAVEHLTDNDLRTFTRTLLSTIDGAAHRSTPGRAAAQLGFAWDGPAHAADNQNMSNDRMSPEAAYPPARRLFATALELLADISEQGTPVPSAAIAIHLSPYFFGGPEAERLLALLGRTAVGSLPISLHYDAATPQLFDGFSEEPAERVIAQTVTISLARAARVSTDLEDFLARIETRTEAAAAAHRAKHDFLQRVFAERGGPLAALRSGFGTAPMTDPRTMEYRIAAKDGGVAALGRAGAPWIAPGEALGVAEAALAHLRESCARCSAAAALRFTLADAGAARPLARVLDRRIPQHALQPPKSLAAESQLHALYDEAPFFTISGESFSAPAEAAAFIQHAFLHTPCRALRIL